MYQGETAPLLMHQMTLLPSLAYAANPLKILAILTLLGITK